MHPFYAFYIIFPPKAAKEHLNTSEKLNMWLPHIFSQGIICQEWIVCLRMAIPVASLPKGNRSSLSDIPHSEKLASFSLTIQIQMGSPTTYEYAKYSD